MYVGFWCEFFYAYQSVFHDKHLLYKNLFISFGRLSKRVIKNKNDGFNNYQIKKWILNPIFNDKSFAFRPKRSIHLALSKVKKSWKVVQWFGFSDIIKVFENINYHRLINEIEKTIDDPILINELWKMINFKVIDLNSKYRLSSGISQDSILSSFLFNIYMTSFDNFISDLIKKINIESSNSNNLEYKKQINLGLKTYKDLNFRKKTKLLKIERDKNIAKEIFLRKGISESTKIYYLRYADDILFGFNSSKEVAKQVIFESESFIKSDLYLSHFSIKLIHAKSDSVKFLGFRLNLFDGNFYFKTRQIISLQKVKASLKRKRIAESEKYFKLVQCITSKMYRQLINSVQLESQTLVKKFQIKELNNNKIKRKVLIALKASLSAMETEFALTNVKSNILKKSGSLKTNPHIILVEQKKNIFLKHILLKWIEKAQELVIKVDNDEIDCAVSQYLSPNFVKIRKEYFRELDKIYLKEFSKKVILNTHKNVSICHKPFSFLKKVAFDYFIRITFPVKEIRKKLRFLGVLNKIVTRPVGLLKLISMPIHEIINWYSLKVFGLWDYYCCVDNIWELKQTLNWVFRYSLLGTLAAKCKSSLKQIINNYSLSPKVKYVFINKKKEKEIGVLAFFPSKEFFNHKKKQFNIDFFSFLNLGSFLCTQWIITNAVNMLVNCSCGVKICKNFVQEGYYVKKFRKRFLSNYVNILNIYKTQKWKGIELALKRKQIFLCKNCHIKIFNSLLDLNDLDFNFMFSIESKI